MPTGDHMSREALLLQQSEKTFQARVEALGRLRGWRVYHTHDSRRSEAGFPDLVCVRPPVVVFAELKRPGGHLGRKQQEWLGLLAACGEVQAHLWRPQDWERIDQVLR